MKVPKEFVAIMTTLDTAYQKQADRSRLMLYYTILKDIDINILTEAIKCIVMTEEYYPAPASIRKRVLKDNTISISSDESLKLVNKLISNYGYYRCDEGMEWLKKQDENTYNIVKAIGYNTISGTGKNVWVNLFCRLHKEVNEKKTDLKLLTENLQAEIDNAKEMLYIE